MYFIVIMAFAFVLSEGLPPEQFNLFRHQPVAGAFAVIVGQISMIVATAWLGRLRTLARLDHTIEGHEEAADRLSATHHVILWMLAITLTLTMVCTPWIPLVRSMDGLARVPLAAELVILMPFFAALGLAWIVLYEPEVRLRREARALEAA